MDGSSPGSSVHGVCQARTLQWVAISFSRWSSQPRDWTPSLCTVSRFFTNWCTKEAPRIIQRTYKFNYLMKQYQLVRTAKEKHNRFLYIFQTHAFSSKWVLTMQMQHFLQIYCAFELNFNIVCKETSSLKLMLIQPLIEFYAMYIKGDHWKLQNSWKIMRIASISKHHLSHFMQTDKNRRKPPTAVKYSGCMALGSNNYIVDCVLNYQPYVFQQVTESP